MELALAHIGTNWHISLYQPDERRSLDQHIFASALSAIAYVRHWREAGASIRPASQCIYNELLTAVQAEAGVVRAVGA